MRALPRFGLAALPHAFDFLCRRLSDEASTDIPVVAAEALGQFGASASAAGPFLARAVQTGNAQVRRAALRALTRILPAEAASAFAAALQDAELNVRRQASAGICRIAAPSEEIKGDLLEALRDPDLRIKANAATCLANFDSLPSEAEPLLIACTATANPALRRAVAAALGRITSSGSREALRTLARDPTPKVRQIAEKALSNLEPEPVVLPALDPLEPQRELAVGPTADLS
jgi:HEAT repeat protein